MLGLIALAIRLDSRGPALFRQQRIGRGGKPFSILKFRSMVVNADALLDAQGGASGNRVTRFGKLLRLSSLDELPQLINIVRGEMSFIGPRPGPAERHERMTSEQRRRCDVYPGVTGLAQVSGRNTLRWSRRIELDVEYVKSYSWWLDVKILVRTVGVVFTGSGVVLDRNPRQVDDVSQTAACSFQRIEPALVRAYQKDADGEDLLRILNDSLAAAHDQQLLDLPDEHATIHVIGAPRSGTTLAMQIIAASLDVGYINNLIASFWRAPAFGVRLSEKLLPGVRPTAFASDYGRTPGIGEPHEFGYFWSYLLDYAEMVEKSPAAEDQINWRRLQQQLTGIAHAFGKPVLFKSFLLAWHVRKFQQVSPKSLLVWIRRDPVDNALSLLKAREAQLGSIDKWISMQPAEYAWLRHESPAMQVAGQVYFIERAIERQLAKADANRMVVVSYRDLCEQPQQLVDEINSHLAQLGSLAERLTSAPTRFSTRTKSFSDHSLYGEVRAAFHRLEQEQGVARTAHRQAA